MKAEVDTSVAGIMAEQILRAVGDYDSYESTEVAELDFGGKGYHDAKIITVSPTPSDDTELRLRSPFVRLRGGHWYCGRRLLLLDFSKKEGREKVFSAKIEAFTSAMESIGAEKLELGGSEWDWPIKDTEKCLRAYFSLRGENKVIHAKPFSELTEVTLSDEELSDTLVEGDFVSVVFRMDVDISECISNLWLNLDAICVIILKK